MIRVLIAGFAGLVISCPGSSQGTSGRILGAVTDQTGSAIVSASITIRNVERGVSRALATDDAGDYNAPNLVPGTYTVRAEAKGFKIIERQNVLLEARDEGDAIGCTNLGILYRNRALPKSDTGAIDLFERGCRNGDSRACRELGYMFAHGDGVPKDENRAAEHYKLADALSHVHRIPIRVEDSLILVSTTIQDEDALLIVDTGSSRTVLIAKYLPPGEDLKPTQKVATLLGTGQAHTVAVNWKLDDREIQLPALVGDFTFPHGAVGILGSDLLGMFKSVHFDYSNLVLILKD